MLAPRANCSATAVRLLSRTGEPAVLAEPFFLSLGVVCYPRDPGGSLAGPLTGGGGRIGSGTRRSSYVPAVVDDARAPVTRRG
jgi:hypothetical protein